MRLPSDTTANAEQFLIAGYRRMAPAEKLDRVLALNRALEELALARIRLRYGADLSDEETRLRLASLRHDARFMTKAFGWDPRIRGL